MTLGKRRPVIFVFRLNRPGRVRFVISRPGCGVVGTFTRRGHPGMNRVRFAGRLHGRKLAAGAYRIRARSHGATVLKRKLVVAGSPVPCGVLGEGTFGGSLSEGGGSGGASAKQPGAREKSQADRDEASTQKPQGRRSSGVLGTRASKVIPGSGGTELVLLVLLALATFLLALGALPRDVVPHPAAAAFLARRRALIAAGGLTVLGAFLISYFVA